MNNYEDIINLPHHVSATRPHMTLHDRAAQFAPFAALTGYGAEINEAGRYVTEKIELAADAQTELDRKLQILQENISAKPEISITYFVPDKLKNGGIYLTVSATVIRIDTHKKELILENKTSISIDDLIEIDGNVFNINSR